MSSDLPDEVLGVISAALGTPRRRFTGEDGRRYRRVRQYLYSARDLIDAATNIVDLDGAIPEIWEQYKDASPGTKAKISRAIAAKRESLAPGIDKKNPLIVEVPR